MADLSTCKPDGCAVGLESVWLEVVLPTSHTLDSLGERVRCAREGYQPTESGVLVRDPARVGVVLTTRST